jgi:hypothetical protein
MGSEQLFGNFSSSVPELALVIDSFVFILQIIGGILGFVVIYWVVISLLNLRKINTLAKILDELKEINKKLDNKTIK